MSLLIYLNGEYVPKEEAKISVYDHGFLYGDGVFEGIRAYSGNVFRLKEHVDRLYDSAKSILLTIPHTREEMEEIIVETLRKNELDSAYIRVIVSRGVGDLGLDPNKCEKAQVIVIAEELALFPKELYEKGLEVVSVSVRRNRPDVLSPNVKSLNYLNNILAKISAHQAGVSEALLLNTEGYVAEGTGENVFLVKDGVILTPPVYLGALKGITRGAIIDIAKKLGYELKEQPFTLHDVYAADEIFLTGTAAEVVPIVKVDGRPIADGKPGVVTKHLLEGFRQLVTADGRKIYPERVSQAG
ncbi:branched-chain amino-acid aminotransferase [[Clostridium] ultunense Esp]|nr:branched-chain amino-acid aminotransferase [[Clostridium] ultunense Esp]